MANNFSELIYLFHKSKCLSNNRASRPQILQFLRFISYWLDIRVTIRILLVFTSSFVPRHHSHSSNGNSFRFQILPLRLRECFLLCIKMDSRDGISNAKPSSSFRIRKKSTSASGLLRFSHSTILLSIKNPGINPRVFAVAFPFNLCSDCEELIFIFYTWTAIKRSDKEESLLGAPSQPREMQKIHVTG